MNATKKKCWIAALLLALMTLTQGSACFEPSPAYAVYHPAHLEAEHEAEHEERERSPILEEAREPEQPAKPKIEPDETTSQTKKDEERGSEPIEEEPTTEKLIGVINVNTAGHEQLKLLPRVGEALAGRIEVYREKRPFTRATQLRRVKGIGRATYSGFAVHLRVEGETTLRRR